VEDEGMGGKGIKVEKLKTVKISVPYTFFFSSHT
jgi:hypothetical protein